ncbi:MAG: histidine kinase dimerization/phosphoacceptor domain -containing protein [Pseudomonadota bacterium]
MIFGTFAAMWGAAPVLAQAPASVCARSSLGMSPQQVDRLSAACGNAILNGAGAARDAAIMDLLTNDFYILKTVHLEPLFARLAPDVPFGLRAYGASPLKEPPHGIDDAQLDALLRRSRDRPVERAFLAYEKASRAFFADEIKDVLEWSAVCLEAARPAGLDRFIADCTNIAGIGHDALNREVDAVLSYTEAIDAFTAIGDEVAALSPLHNIGTIFSELGDHRRASSYYDRIEAVCLEQLERDPDNRSALDQLAYVWLAEGEALQAEGRHEQAIALFDDSIETQSRTDSTSILRKTLFVRAQSEGALQRTTAALRTGQRAFDLGQNAGSEGRDLLGFSILVWMADINIRIGKDVAARQLLERASTIFGRELSDVSILDDIDDKSVAYKFATSLSNVLAGLGMPADALVYANAALDLRDDLASAEVLMAMANTDVLFQLRDRTAKLRDAAATVRTSRRDLDLATLELERSQLRTGLAVTAGIAALLAALLAVSAWRTQRRRVAAKEVLFDEVQHRVKNNFQVLSSMLNLAVRKRGDSPGAAVVSHAVERVQAMAILHDYLHTSRDRAPLAAEDYFEELVHNLRKTIDRDEVAVRLDVEPGTLSKTSIVPLGLMICEIVTNAYKYAFDETGGEIAITVRRAGGGRADLRIADNGGGLTSDRQGIGTGLVSDLAEQMGGQAERTSSPDGVIWQIRGLKI